MKIGYARVSTDEQSLEMQIQALQAAGAERIFYDQGVSGGAVIKPALAECLQLCRAGDELIVYRFDRLSRSLRDLIELVEKFGNAGLGFRSLHENIDMASPAGRLMFHVIGALGEFERALLQARTRDGLAAARQAGQQLGRPPAISDEQWREAVELMAAPHNKPVAAVATLLGVSRQAVYKRINRDKTVRAEAERIKALIPKLSDRATALFDAEAKRAARIARIPVETHEAQ